MIELIRSATSSPPTTYVYTAMEGWLKAARWCPAVLSSKLAVAVSCGRIWIAATSSVTSTPDASTARRAARSAVVPAGLFATVYRTVTVN